MRVARQARGCTRARRSGRQAQGHVARGADPDGPAGPRARRDGIRSQRGHARLRPAARIELDLTTREVGADMTSRAAHTIARVQDAHSTRPPSSALRALVIASGLILIAVTNRWVSWEVAREALFGT